MSEIRRLAAYLLAIRAYLHVIPCHLSAIRGRSGRRSKAEDDARQAVERWLGPEAVHLDQRALREQPRRCRALACGSAACHDVEQARRRATEKIKRCAGRQAKQCADRCTGSEDHGWHQKALKWDRIHVRLEPVTTMKMRYHGKPGGDGGGLMFANPDSAIVGARRIVVVRI